LSSKLRVVTPQPDPSTSRANSAPPKFRLDKLCPIASLNRRRFLVPSALDPALAGRTAYDVLSTRALVDTIAATATELGLDPTILGAASPHALNRALTSDDDV